MKKMKISANNDYLDDEIKVGDIVNVRPYPGADRLVYEFEHNSEPGLWLCCEARELDELDDDQPKDVWAGLKNKDEALKLAAQVFDEYAEQHFAKDSWLKGVTNVGLATIMRNALKADS